jgi:hypothetical protein|tara:strand:+ start:13731 stop:14162 length:432 start_codon:yes stop_codon:yes gene_type:complete
MKKILIAILLITVSFSSYSQRKSKKTKSTNKNYLVVKIFEKISFSDEELYEMSNLGSDVMNREALNEMLTKELLYKESNIKVKYEFGQNYTKEEYEKMMQFQQESQTIAQAVYGASQFGWQIVSTNTVALKNDNRLHYIYMSK